MENNEAIVVTIKNITPIPNKQRIVQADVYLYEIKLTQVVVGIETKEDSHVVYVDSNMALSDKLLEDYPDLGKYLGKGNRVKAVKLGDVISNGFCIEIEKFLKYFNSKEEMDKTFIHGYSFTSINGIEICHKYIPKINVSSIQTNNNKKKNKGKVISRMIPNQFNFHFDTKSLLKNAHIIQPEDIITISDKWHGTSAIISKCLVKKKLNLKNKIAKLLGVNIITTEYDYIYASRRVVKNGNLKPENHYYNEDIWKKASDRFRGKLNNGESIYFEIVGYLENNKFIQKNYDYGCTPGNHKIVVYRITHTGTDGVIYEYPWGAMKQRCIELGVDTVREFYYGKAKDLYPELHTDVHWNENFINNLRRDYLEVTCDICTTGVPREGIVLRIEGKEIKVFKLKSNKFLLHDSKSKDEGNEDIEDIN